MLKIINLVKRYNKVLAVNNLNLDIDKGEIFGFVGANGAGKTTTMKIVAGLLRPTFGEVFVDGLRISENLSKVKRRIGYMPDFFGVYDDLKVNEYMEFYAGAYGIPFSESKKVCGELIELVNLTEKADAYVDSLSRGMKQRLCLARSLIHNPELLILDEPASGLDPRARAEIKEILRELKKMGKTIIISSHILPELSEMCTSIGIIDKGQMVACGSVDNIMREAKARRILKIRVIDGIPEAVRFLEEQPDIQDISVMSEFISAAYNGDDIKLSAILTEMVRAGIPVISFSETEKNLESVFINLTGGGIKNAG